MSVAMSPIQLVKILAACVALCFAGTPHASTCAVTSAVLSFGPYDGLAAGANLSPGLVRVSCTKDGSLSVETVNVNLQLLPSAPGAAGSRKIDSGGSTLSLDIHTDLLRTRLWGDGTLGTFTLSGTVLLVVPNSTVIVEFPVYGRIPAHLASPAGAYTGQFSILLTF